MPSWLLVAVLVLLVFYTLFTGATPSVVRAAIMSAILLLAPLVGRRYDPIAALAVSSIAMTLADPNVLAEAGFQLSFVPMLGIALISPKFSSMFGSLRVPTIVSAPLAAGFGAQLATFPLVALLWEKVSLVSAFATLFVDLTLLSLMVTGIATAIIGALFAPLASLTGLLVWACGALMILTVRLWAALPFASVSVESIGSWWVIPYYLALGLAIGLQSVRRWAARWNHLLTGKLTPALAGLAAALWVALIALVLWRS